MDGLSRLSRHAEELEEKVTCPVCLSIYSNPKLVVPCCHTLCSDCYIAMHSQGGGQFACPLCREKCTVAPLAARRNAAMEDLVAEALRVRAEIANQETEKSAESGWPWPLSSQIQCKSEPWDLVLVQHRDANLFFDSASKRILRANIEDSTLSLLPQDLLFCISDDLEDVRLFSLDGRVQISNWRLTWPDNHEEFYDIYRASFDRGSSHLVLSDLVRHRVVIADLTGAVVNVIKNIKCPSASCVQAGLRRLFVISENGTRITSFWIAEGGCRPTGASSVGFQLLSDIRCDELKVYTTDCEAQQVCVLSADGLNMLSSLSLPGHPRSLQLLNPGFLLAVIKSDRRVASSLVLMSATQRGVTIKKELTCPVKITGLAFDSVRDLLLLCDSQNWTINGFSASPLTFLSF